MTGLLIAVLQTALLPSRYENKELNLVGFGEKGLGGLAMNLTGLGTRTGNWLSDTKET